VATLSSLTDMVRSELGDLGKSFVSQFVADGTTNRFKLHYAPLDAGSVKVFKNGVDLSDACTVEEATGVLITDDLYEDGAEIIVSGTYYRYYTTTEIAGFVGHAVEHHGARKTDALGRRLTLESLPKLEEYPVALYAVTLALYTLATDASFDIDIVAPDGVSIPRAQRYRQLMEMIASREAQYKELCVQLGIGMYSIEVFSLRRISHRTNRYVPVYQPQEYDDKSHPRRADLPLPTYGDQELPWPTQDKDLLAYQGFAFMDTLHFDGDFTGKSFIARLLNQRGGINVVQTFDLTVTEIASNKYTAAISLTVDQTLRPAQRTWYQLASVDDVTGEIIELKGGDFFIERAREVIV
jgi:hypothetical protein